MTIDGSSRTAGSADLRRRPVLAFPVVVTAAVIVPAPSTSARASTTAVVVESLADLEVF